MLMYEYEGYFNKFELLKVEFKHYWPISYNHRRTSQIRDEMATMVQRLAWHSQFRYAGCYNDVARSTCLNK